MLRTRYTHLNTRLIHSAQALLIAGMMLLASGPAHALTLLRDAGLEHGLARLAAPVLRGAGLIPGQIKILIVKDDALNAFVTDTRHIFVTSGLIQKLNSASELQAVLAHEAAHIANGHLSRRAGNARAASTTAGLGVALAAASLALSGRGDAATGLALGAQSAARRNFLAHTRAEESAADLSSVRILRRAGIDPTASLRVLDHFRGQEALSARRQDPYARSHPLTRARIRALEATVAGLPTQPKDDP
ncbi:MAG: M48 family metallopeptidase, partial [Paracoccaceae bacterium]